MTEEGKLQHRCRKYAELLRTSGKPIKLWRTHSTGMGERGRPDLEGVINGKYIGIELKTPTAYRAKHHSLSAQQRRQGKMIDDANGLFRVVCRFEDFKILIDSLL